MASREKETGVSHVARTAISSRSRRLSGSQLPSTRGQAKQSKVMTACAPSVARPLHLQGWWCGAPPVAALRQSHNQTCRLGSIRM
jgi:hypothetical protein